MKRLSFIALVFTCFVIITGPIIVSAQIPGLGQDTPLATYISNSYLVALMVGGSLFFVMVVYGGFLYMAAGANEAAASTAKHAIFNAVLGLVLLLGAHYILCLLGVLSGEVCIGGGVGANPVPAQGVAPAPVNVPQVPQPNATTPPASEDDTHPVIIQIWNTPNLNNPQQVFHFGFQAPLLFPKSPDSTDFFHFSKTAEIDVKINNVKKNSNPIGRSVPYEISTTVPANGGGTPLSITIEIANASGLIGEKDNANNWKITHPAKYEAPNSTLQECTITNDQLSATCTMTLQKRNSSSPYVIYVKTFGPTSSDESLGSKEPINNQLSSLSSGTFFINPKNLPPPEKDPGILDETEGTTVITGKRLANPNEVIGKLVLYYEAAPADNLIKQLDGNRFLANIIYVAPNQYLIQSLLPDNQEIDLSGGVITINLGDVVSNAPESDLMKHGFVVSLPHLLIIDPQFIDQNQLLLNKKIMREIWPNPTLAKLINYLNTNQDGLFQKQYIEFSVIMNNNVPITVQQRLQPQDAKAVKKPDDAFYILNHVQSRDQTSIKIFCSPVPLIATNMIGNHCSQVLAPGNGFVLQIGKIVTDSIIQIQVLQEDFIFNKDGIGQGNLVKRAENPPVEDITSEVIKKCAIDDNNILENVPEATRIVECLVRLPLLKGNVAYSHINLIINTYKNNQH